MVSNRRQHSIEQCEANMYTYNNMTPMMTQPLSSLVPISHGGKSIHARVDPSFCSVVSHVDRPKS